MLKIKFLIFLTLGIPIMVMAQKIENVDFRIHDNVVTVKYDLVDCPENYVYDMRLKFKTDAGDYIYPKNPSGDLKEVSEGRGKEIIWNVLSDNQEIKGNISAIVEIYDRHYIRPRREKTAHSKIKGGPSNAFLSMVLPGLGDYFVNKYSNYGSAGTSTSSDSYSYNVRHNKYESRKNGYWYLIPVTYYLCLYGALSEYSGYQKSYSDYHNATFQASMDKYFSDASTHYENAQVYLGIAATAWLCDVIHVTAKGYKNRKHQLHGYSMTEPKTNYYFVSTGHNFQFGLMHKF